MKSPTRNRIRDLRTARRCVRAIAAYLDHNDDSPLAAADLRQSMEIFEARIDYWRGEAARLSAQAIANRQQAVKDGR